VAGKIKGERDRDGRAKKKYQRERKEMGAQRRNLESRSCSAD
jgi:hypothetical protein